MVCASATSGTAVRPAVAPLAAFVTTSPARGGARRRCVIVTATAQAAATAMTSLFVRSAMRPNKNPCQRVAPCVPVSPRCPQEVAFLLQRTSRTVATARERSVDAASGGVVPPREARSRLVCQWPFAVGQRKSSPLAGAWRAASPWVPSVAGRHVRCISSGGETSSVMQPFLTAVYDIGSAVAPVVVGVALPLLSLLFLAQRKLIFLPRAGVADPTARGGKPQVLFVKAEPNGHDRYAAVFFEPPTPKAPVLVYFHGNADELGNGAAFLGNYFRKKHGLGLYGIEYPGYGLARPGSPTEQSINAAAEAMLRHLIDVIGVPESRIVLFGQSIGCGVAVEMARRGHGSRLVLIAPFTSLPDMAGTFYPFLKPLLKVTPWLVLDRFDNKAKAPDVALPTLVIHGKEDEIVPFWMGQTVADKIPGARLLAVQGMGHNDAFNDDWVLANIASFSARADPTGR
eukprot:TRINITY_DN22915_c0_g5_i1.p1 TRINITY_DN22915_c0_g5~~TRINITY_DN22915_c0_g5_i1.p1  ORF type:complete len:457 (-),score=50.59 TRINITY_DN22915_c0_g5_i1:86-1456(-)